MSEEEKKAIKIEKESTKLKTLIELLYTDRLSQYGKRELVNYIEKQQKEIEEKNIAINKMSKNISRQLEEIEEKSTIIMAGAEKVKQLEKGNRSLMESRIKWKNRYYKEKAKNKECISKDKIREFIKEELPDDEIMKWNIIYDVNGIDLRIKLEKMLEEN